MIQHYVPRKKTPSDSRFSQTPFKTTPYSVKPLLLLTLTSILILQTADSIELERFEHLQNKVKTAFYHAYDNYLKNAFPADELQPLTCQGRETWGAFSLTLIDSLDTLLVIGNKTEFARVAKYLTKNLSFDYDMNVSVFESNIRIVGGLISAHLLAGTQVPKYMLNDEILPEFWPCRGKLLDLAVELADKILPAFDTKTGMPYGTVNLIKGVPVGETTITCTAGIGTFLIEFGSLSELTGDPKYMDAAKRAMDALYNHRSVKTGLLGNHIKTDSGAWVAAEAGIGGSIDSYYEYLIKGAVLFNNETWMEQWIEYKSNIDTLIKTKEDIYIWANMHSGSTIDYSTDSLGAFLPGVQTMYGDVEQAFNTVKKLIAVAMKYGNLPEKFNLKDGAAQASRSGSPLRPELIESIFYLYRSTRHPQLIDIGEALLNSIEVLQRTDCGYATIKSVLDHSLEDRMESFFLAETLKYFYLLFDPDNFLHDHDDQTFYQTGQVFHDGECILNAGGYVFNTEAHPIDPGALDCCRSLRESGKLEKGSWFTKNQKIYDENVDGDSIVDGDFSEFDDDSFDKGSFDAGNGEIGGKQYFYTESTKYTAYNNTWWNVLTETLPTV